jgi:hypothetical protein
MGLQEEEKAKQDYQLQMDKQRMALQYNNKWWELMWDKLVFAVFIAIFGSVGYLLVNSRLEDRRHADAKELENRRNEETRNLEQFKLDESRQRFLLEKRLDALLGLNSAMSDVTRVYFAHAGAEKTADAQTVEKDYNEMAAKAREIINRSTLLFDVEFETDVDRYLEIHRQISRISIAEWGKYRRFMASLSNEFDALSKAALQKREKDSGGISRVRMTLADIPYEKRIAMKPVEYVEAHFKHWQSKQK